MSSFYRDGLKTIEHFQSYIDELAENVHKIKLRHDEEKKKLVDLRNLLKTSLSLDKEVREPFGAKMPRQAYPENNLKVLGH